MASKKVELGNNKFLASTQGFKFNVLTLVNRILLAKN